MEGAIALVPPTIESLQKSAKSLDDLAVYCAQTAASKPDKAIQESKKFALEALTAVAYQVNSAAESLLNLFELQNGAMTELTLRSGSLSARLQMTHDGAGLSAYSELLAEKKFARFSKARKLPESEVPMYEQRSPLQNGRSRVNFSLLDTIGVGGNRGGSGGAYQPPQNLQHGNSSSRDSNDDGGEAFTGLEDASRRGTISGRNLRQGTVRRTILPSPAKPISAPAPPEDFTPVVPVAPVAPIAPSIPSAPVPPSMPPTTFTSPPPPPPLPNSDGQGSHDSSNSSIPAPPSPAFDAPPPPPAFPAPPMPKTAPPKPKNAAPPPPTFAPPPAPVPTADFPMPPSDSENLPPPPPDDIPSVPDMLPPPPPAPPADDLPPPPPEVEHLPPPPAVPSAPVIICQARALYDYDAAKGDELTLRPDEIVSVISKSDDGWWFGTLNGQQGMFPGNYVEEI